MDERVLAAGTKLMVDTVDGQNSDEFKSVYLGSLQLIERLHRRFLEVVKVELDRLHVQDINNIQALILYNVGHAEMTVGELTSRGYYLGSNVSYNVKKMVENLYLEQERSPYDRRSIRLRLSQKGLELYEKINSLYETHVVARSTGLRHAQRHERCAAGTGAMKFALGAPANQLSAAL
jgi:DNA-binding MarR family transcriptional regulator